MKKMYTVTSMVKNMKLLSHRIRWSVIEFLCGARTQVKLPMWLGRTVYLVLKVVGNEKGLEAPIR